MGFRAVFILLLLIGGVAFGLWWTERAAGTPDGGGEVAATDAVLGGRRLLEATKIELQFHRDRPAIEIERGDRAGYRLVEPIEDLASSAVLMSLAGIYDTARMKLDFAPEDVTDERLEQRGFLPNAQGRIRVEWAGGVSTELEFGNPGPFGDDMFLRRDGAIYSASSALRSAMTLNVTMFREAAIFRNVSAQVGRLRITRRSADAQGGEEQLTFVRRGDGYVLEERPSIDLNQHEVISLIDGVLALRADRFVRGRRNVGPRTADCLVEVSGAFGEESVEMTIDDRGQLFGWAKPREVEFYARPATFKRVFTEPLQALRTRLLYSPELIDELQQVTIDSAEGSLAFRRDPARGLRMVQPVVADANPTAVNELRTKLLEFGVVEFVDDDPKDLAVYGLEEPRMVLKLQGLAGGGSKRESAEIRIGSAKGPLTFAQRAGSPNVVAVATASVDVFARGWLDYVGLEVMSIPPRIAVGKIAVLHAGVERAVYERGEDGGWRPAGQSDAARVDDVADVYDAARKLVGARAVDAGAGGIAGGPMVYTLIFYAATGQEWTRLVVDTGRDPMLARRERAGGEGESGLGRLVFELTHRDSEDLRELIGR